MGSPLISVIIPVHNMAPYLDESIGSWTVQTLHDIEIILIDDASTDSSLELMRAWADKDRRIRIQSFPVNKSAWSARKAGIESAAGEYIMFADADDSVLPEACKELYDEMKRDPVDILHFGSEIINVNGVPEKRIESMRRFLLPYNGKLEGKDVLTACFLDGKYGFTLWNKMFSASLCKRAFLEQEEAVLPKAQDKLAYFLIAYYASSYRGILSKPYYKYYFGRGSTGIAVLTKPQFERICSMALVSGKLKEFLKSEKKSDEFKDIEQKFHKGLLTDSVNQWINNVADEDKASFYDILMEYWKPEDVVTILANRKEVLTYPLAKQLKNAQSLIYDKHPVKTIGVYYHSIVNGGVQRVLCNLVSLWRTMGYEVVVLTDFQPDADDYPLPKEVRRIVIPDYRTINRKNYGKRAKVISRIIRENHIDLFVGHAWVLDILFWDQLLIKSLGTAYIIHCHNVFTINLLNTWADQKSIVAPYYLADAVITLSDVDRQFWIHFNNNVHTVINPFTDDFQEWPVSSCQGQDILWVGRISDEKCPFDLLDIIEKVQRSIPSAKLHIVGASKEPGYFELFQKEIVARHLEDSIILHGFHKDVKPFYRKASLFLLTSKYEGYPLTLQESLMAGLPVVAYELPFLTLMRGNSGVLPVRQRDTDGGARAIITLLQDDEMRKERGKESRRFIEQFKKYDFKKTWKQIFESLFETHYAAVTEDERLMMETMIDHHDVGVWKLKDEMVFNRRKTVRAAILMVKGKDYLVENGMKATAKKTVSKIANHLRKKL